VVEVADQAVAECIEDLLNGTAIGEDSFRQAVARWLCDRAFTHPCPCEAGFTSLVGDVGTDRRPENGVQSDGSSVLGTTSLDVADVSLLVPVYNRHHELRTLLESFGPLLSKLGGVVVVDDGSTDQTSEVARTFDARVIRHDQPGGPARARNAGLASVTTPLVLMIDSDCTVSSDPLWLEELLAHLADESVAIAAPRVQSSGGTTLAERFQGARSALDQGTAAGYIGPGMQVGTVPSAALLMRTAVADSLGGFDASMRAAEDTDFIWRTVDAGWRLRYVPTAVVTHHDPPRIRQMLKTHRGYGRWVEALEKKHGHRVRAVRINPSTPIALVAGFSLHPAGAALAVAASAFPLRQEVVARRGTDRSVRSAVKHVARTHLGGTLRLFQMTIRCWLPLTLLGALVSSRVRFVAVIGLLLRGLTHRPSRAESPKVKVSRLEFMSISALDDAAHCIGVWEGCWRHRGFGAVLPAMLRPTRRQTMNRQTLNAELLHRGGTEQLELK
jgi:mycofactocin glycosyltransferase